MADLMPTRGTYDEYKTVVQYPPEPPRPCGGEPVHMRTGGDMGLELARKRQEFHVGNGATATVYRRTWTPGPWVAVDAESATTPEE